MATNSQSNLVSVLTDIATAINAKGVSGPMTAYEMPSKIMAIEGGGSSGVSQIVAGSNIAVSPSAGTGTVTLSTNLRYDLKQLDLTLSSITIDSTAVTAYVTTAYDRAINTISTDTSAYPIYVYLPSVPNDSGARDFCIRIECLSSAIPTIGFLGSGSESCDFESEDDEWATLEVGANFFNFTETKR